MLIIVIYFRIDDLELLFIRCDCSLTLILGFKQIKEKKKKDKCSRFNRCISVYVISSRFAWNYLFLSFCSYTLADIVQCCRIRLLFGTRPLSPHSCILRVKFCGKYNFAWISLILIFPQSCLLKCTFSFNFNKGIFISKRQKYPRVRVDENSSQMKRWERESEHSSNEVHNEVIQAFSCLSRGTRDSSVLRM